MCLTELTSTILVVDKIMLDAGRMERKIGCVFFQSNHHIYNSYIGYYIKRMDQSLGTVRVYIITTGVFRM